MSNSVGRRADKIWNQYTTEKEPITGKVVSNVCNICLKQISAQPCRMWKHLNKCRANREMQLSAATTMASIAPLPPPVTVPSMVVQIVPPAKKPKMMVNCEPPSSHTNPNIDFDINSVKTGKKKKEELDECLGELVFGLNLPLAITEHHLFQKFVKTLRPTYNLPQKDHLSSAILEKVYENNQRRLWETLKGKKVAIWQDIFSSQNSEPIISHYICSVQKSYLLDAVPTSFECMATVIYANLLVAAIDKAENELECKVIAVLTENNEIGTSLQWHLQERFPNLVVHTCHTRLLKNIAQSLIPLDILDDVIAVQKHFRDHSFELDALMNQMNGNKPYYPVNANLENQLHCLRSFADNYSKYVEILSTENPNLTKDEQILATIHDENVYSRVDQCLERLQLILSTMEKVQSESASIADAVYEWMTLDERKEFVTSELYQTTKQSALTPVAIASYMLHPIYRGKNLTGAQNTLGFEFLTSKNPLFVAAAINLQQSDSNFYPVSHLNLAVAEHLTPSVWWRSLAKFENISTELIDFCETLMSIPASTKNMHSHSLAIDDIFSKNISNLEIDKIQMLCSIYNQQSQNNLK